jgi:hypothetical protein
MLFLKFLFLVALGGILFFAGPYVFLLMVSGLSETIGIWSLLVGFVVFCWVIWAFTTLLI